MFSLGEDQRQKRTRLLAAVFAFALLAGSAIGGALYFFQAASPAAEASIANGANAVDLLGLYDDDVSAPAPVYTKQAINEGTINNGPNKFGFGGTGGVALDETNHRLFVADGTHSRVLVYNLTAGNLLIDRIPDTVLGQANFYSNTRATSQASLNLPVALAYDSANNRLFVSDGLGTKRIVVFDTASVSNGESAVNVLGATTFTSNGGGTTQSTLNIVYGMAYDTANNRLFVGENLNNRVTVFDVASITNGENAVSVLGQTTFTAATAATSQAGMNRPIGVTYDGTNNRLFVAQDNGNRVTVYDVASITNGENAVSVLGQTTFTGSTSAATQAGMVGPQGLAYDAAGSRLFVSQQAHRVTVYDVASITNGENAVSVLGQSTFTGVSLATTQTGMNYPEGLAYDATNGRLFVSDSENHRVLTFDVASIADGENAVDALGQYDDDYAAPEPIFTKGAQNDGPNRFGFDNAFGIAVDTANHRLFVADWSNNRVLVYAMDTGNILLDRLPDYVLGQPNFYTGTYSVTQAGLASPYGVTYDSANDRLYVPQSSSNRVSVFDTASITSGENAVAVLGQSAFTNSTAATTQAGMRSPYAAAVNGAGTRLFVAQGSLANRVTVYDVATVTTGENAINVLGQSTFTGSTAAVTQAGMSGPDGLAYDPTNDRLFVSDANRVTVYDVSSITDGENAINVLGQSTFTTSTAATTQTGMDSPTGLSFDDASQRLFVGEYGNSRVTGFDVNSIVDGEAAIYVLGKSTFTSNAAAITQAGLYGTWGVAYDELSGRLYVSQNLNANRISVFDAGPDTTDPVLTFTAPATTDNLAGQAVSVTLTATDGTPSISVNLTVPCGSLTTANPVSVATSGGTASFTWDVSACSDGTHQLSATGTDAVGNVSDPFTRDVTVDSSYAAVDALGQYDETSLTSPVPAYTKAGINNSPNKLGFSEPYDVEIDTVNHRLFVAEKGNHRVLVFNLDTNNDLLDRIPDNVLGQANFYTGTAATTQAGMNNPGDLAYDSANQRLFVVQQDVNRVTVYDVAAITDGENAVNVIGQATFTGATATTSQTRLNSPKGLAYDATNQRLFVSNQNRVTVYDVTSVTDGEAAINVLGQTTFTGTGSATTQAGMNFPTALAYDSPNTRLFVMNGRRVTTYDVASITDGENAVNVLGQTTFTTNTGAVTQAGMRDPIGLAYDAANSRLFVSQALSHASTLSNRVTVYDVASITDGENAVNVLGQSTFTANATAVTQAGMSYPAGLAYDATNSRLYVAQPYFEYTDIFVVRFPADRVTAYDVASITDGENAIDLLGQYDETSFTVPVPVYTKSGADNSPNRFGFDIPMGVVIDNVSHRLFVADDNNNRVLVFNLDTNNDLLDRIPDNVLGQANFYTGTAATTQAGLNGPRGLAHDAGGQRLFVSNGNRVTVYDVASITNGEGAVNVLGHATFTGTGNAITQAGVSVPQGIAYDPASQRLFVAQSSASRVTVFDVASITNGENAINVLGQTTFTGSANATTQSGMNIPYGIAYDAANQRLFVGEQVANRVTVYDVASITDGENAVNVLGQGTFTTSTGATTQAGMNGPLGLAYDLATQRLFVAQETADRVTAYDVASITDGENATHVYGQTNFTGSTPATSETRLNESSYVAYEPVSGYLWVGDSSNNRVLAFDVGGAPTLLSATTADNDIDGKVDRIVATFSEDLDAATVSGADFTVTSPSRTVSSASETSAGVVTILLTEDASADTNITPSITMVGSIANAGNTATATSGFAVATDAAAPVIMSVSPASGATGVALDANLVLTFSEPMDPTFVEGTEFTVSPDPGSFTPAWSVGDTVVTLDPGTNFAGETLYTVTTTEAQIQAAAGSPNTLLTTGPEDGDWSFTTASTAPAVSVAVAAAPPNPTVNQETVISATFTDPDDGINQIKLFLDGTGDPANLIKTCTFAPAQSPASCSITIGPNLSDGSHTIRATARDTASQTTDSDSTFTVGSFTTAGSMGFSRLKAGTSNVDFSLSFDVVGPDTGPLVVTFPSGFTVTQAFTSGTCSGGGTIGSFGFTTTTITGTKSGCIGTISLSGAKVTLHSTPGTYTVTWTNDLGEGSFTIVDDDQVNVTGQVDQALTFDLDISTTDTGSSPPYAISFGDLTPNTVYSSGTTVPSIWIDLSTNATGGAVVTVRNVNGSSGLVSSGTPADTIPNAAAAMSSSTSNYGICVISVTQTAGGPLEKAGSYASGTCTADGTTNDVKALTTANTSILTTANDPVDAARARISVNLNATSLVPAHPDYADALTFIATATY